MGAPGIEAPPPPLTADAVATTGTDPDLLLARPELPQLARLVDRVPPGQWQQIPGDPAATYISKKEALAISEGDQAAMDRLWGWGGPRQTFEAFSGAAFDGRRLYFFGGGHHHYRGNDLKVFDLKTFAWSRPYDPSYVTDEAFVAARRYVPRHGPRSLHTYDGIIYVPTTNALYMWAHYARHAWKFDIALFEATGDPWKAWQILPDPPNKDSQRLHLHMTALMPDGRVLLVRQGRGRGAMIFDPKTETYSAPGPTNASYTSLAWAPVTGRAYTFRQGRIDSYAADGTDFREGVAQVPTAFGSTQIMDQSGVAYDPTSRRLVFWPGGRVTWTWDPVEDHWTRFPNTDGPAPQSVLPEKPKVFSKFIHIPQVNAFVAMARPEDGLWVYRLPDEDTLANTMADKKRALQAQGFECADTVNGWTCPNLQKQVAQGRVVKGVYRQCARVDGPVEFNGARLENRVCGSKAALIARDGADIRNVHIQDITIGINGACIRWAGGSVRVNRVTCRGADMGLLGRGDRIEISDSVFESTLDHGKNYGHVLYLVSGSEAVIRNTRIADPGNEGHVLKTGMQRTVVENSDLAGGERAYSRVVDAFNGGVLILRDTDLTVGADGGNGDLIGYGGEMRTRFDDNRLVVDGGVLDCSAGRTYHTVHTWPDRLRRPAMDWRPEAVVGCPRVPRR
ncbi:hypothetical protein CKO24_04990 [Rhodothalassium salexigens DSM 2132]|nr:hypothetical protein [Rhodothalassium salexigens DSM 2132]